MVSDALKTINVETGPGFLSVEDENGYVQVAGDGREFVVEWSEFHGDETTLYAAGKLNGDTADSEFRALHGTISIKERERLNLSSAAFICSEFVEQRVRPDSYTWREII